MKKIFVFLFLATLFATSCNKSDEFNFDQNDDDISPKEEKIFEGNKQLESQTEVNTFAAEGYTEIINGTLLITTNDDSDPIVDLSALECLRELSALEITNTDLVSLKGLQNIKRINNHFTIEANEMLLNLDHLDSLESVVFHFLIGGNSSLQNLNGLFNLKTVEGGNLHIYNNDNLLEINGFDSLENTGGGSGLIIAGNEKLSKITGFNKYSYGGVVIEKVPNLEILDGFDAYDNANIGIFKNEKLTTVSGFRNMNEGSITCLDNPELSDFPGFNELKIIDDLWLDDNDNIKTLDDFSSLEKIDRILITHNLRLKNYCALTDAIQNNDTSSMVFTITDNGYNPTIDDLLADNCQE